MLERPQSAPPRGRSGFDTLTSVATVRSSRSRPQSAQGRQSSRRSCKICFYSWVDKYGKPQCPKCFSPMNDGFRFEDTAIGQAMLQAQLEFRRKQRKEEAYQWKVIMEAQARGEAKSRSDWQNFRARLREQSGGPPRLTKQEIRRKYVPFL